MKKYEVWLADLDPSFGTESGKKRPVVIVQSNLLNHHSSTIICPISTNVKPTFTLTRVHLQLGDANLTKNSDVMIDQIRAVDNNRFIKKIGTLPTKYHLLINQNIKLVMDL
jgi:mRNA interferase MazF